MTLEQLLELAFDAGRLHDAKKAIGTSSEQPDMQLALVKATKIVDWMITQKYGEQDILHAAVCCDYVGKVRFIKSIASIIASCQTIGVEGRPSFEEFFKDNQTEIAHLKFLLECGEEDEIV